MTVSLRHIVKYMGSQRIVDDLSLEVEAGQLVALLGPSGCGKTTLLRMIAGLLPPDSGEIWLDGSSTKGWDLRRRRVGFVFQNYALFSHMDVATNIAFGLRVKPKAERLSSLQQARRVTELLDLVQLPGLGQRFPHQLSGGQQQRVAIARALAIEPRLLLLDEPFGALDAKVRRELRAELRRLQRRLGMTCILVTHDQDEAREVCDHVVLLNAGRIDQEGSPEQLFARPNSSFARAFLQHPEHSLLHPRSACVVPALPERLLGV